MYCIRGRRSYLAKTLGKDAPQPEWGVPEGWGSYLARGRLVHAPLRTYGAACPLLPVCIALTYRAPHAAGSKFR